MGIAPAFVVESADGRAKFQLADYASKDGGVAVPGDARSVFAVGKVGPKGMVDPHDAGGAGPQSLLRVKPDILAPVVGSDGTGGSDMAAAFAAGFAAAVESAGLPAVLFPKRLGVEPGGIIAVPEAWFRR